MKKKKKLSNAGSTGGVGGNFEGHIQASFVTLMLTGGYAPCLPCWPIVKVKLQGKIDGYETDDLIVFTERENNNERRCILGQIKNSIEITKGSHLFGDVIQAAWNDFNNQKVFTKGKDIICLITGPLSRTDSNVSWLLHHARSKSNDYRQFFREISTTKFISNTKREKLDVFRHHLKNANCGINVKDEDLHEFLKNFYLLGYDMGEEESVVLSLINSHISQFRPAEARNIWSRILEFTNNRNHHAGIIDLNEIPDDIKELFESMEVGKLPEIQVRPKGTNTSWKGHSDATYLAKLILIGAWKEKSECDVQMVSELIGINYEDWQDKARKILNLTDSPLSLNNGIWRIVNRIELWEDLGSYILDHDLDIYKTLAISVLEEPDPAFEILVNERVAASINGKVLEYSNILRQGITEGLAILGTRHESCNHCSLGKVEETNRSVIQHLLTDADLIRWGSLNSLLPILAESAPNVFIEAVEGTLRNDPCPFYELFSQEGDAFFGVNYLAGLLNALETLAWSDEFLVRVCVALGYLAEHDPGGQWANRPSNSLTTILLPAKPQTLASVDKRMSAVEILNRECPEIAWNLIIQLLPNQHRISFGSRKPTWRKMIPDGWEEEIKYDEILKQAENYSRYAVEIAGYDIDRLSVLIDNFDKLTTDAFDILINFISSKSICELPEEQKLLLWEHLTKFINKHRRFQGAKWTLPETDIDRIEKAAEPISPSDPFYLYRFLFTDNYIDLYEGNDDHVQQKKNLDMKRINAIKEIYEQKGIGEVFRFAESAISPRPVGYALGALENNDIERAIFPELLNTKNFNYKEMVTNFIWRRHENRGWEWADTINKSNWTSSQIGFFLTCLPFSRETWNRVSAWLNGRQDEYWIHTDIIPFSQNENMEFAVEKLIEYGRPRAAINCLDWMLNVNQSIDSNICIRALNSAVSSDEPAHIIEQYLIVNLIQYLQSDSKTAEDDLYQIEWAYLSFLNGYKNARPKYLENRLANDPEFFCEVIQLVYRSNKEDDFQKKSIDTPVEVAEKAFLLLDFWKIPPGLQEDGSLSEMDFNMWLGRVKSLCSKSGHLEAALNTIGEVLIHSPPDPSGMWIHSIVANALNDPDSDDMRSGFKTAKYNSRGVYTIDPTGRPERELAEQYHSKAEEVESGGFQRLAATLRELGKDYLQMANHYVSK